MKWDQIEVKWHAMARRVRADLPPATCDAQSRGGIRSGIRTGGRLPPDMQATSVAAEKSATVAVAQPAAAPTK